MLYRYDENTKDTINMSFRKSFVKGRAKWEVMKWKEN